MRIAILGFILTVGLIIRFYNLDVVPAGLTSDEVNNGYDAYSILVTGKDQWGEFLPLISFKGFGDYRSPIYTYLIIPFIKIFDLSGLAVRLPSALAGTISIILLYLLGRKFFSKNVGVVSMFLISISPWAVGLSRQGLESNVAITFYILAIYLFHKIRDNNIYIMLSIFLFFLLPYTYTAYIILSPLTLITLIIIKRKELLPIKKLLLFSLSMYILLLIPLVSQSSAGNTRLSQVGINKNVTSKGLIIDLNERIGDCMRIEPSFACRIIHNKYILFSTTFFKNYLQHFSFDLLYIKGTGEQQYSLLYNRGFLYLFEAVLLIAGVYALIRKKQGKLILILLLIAPIPDSFTGTGHHSRASAMLPLLILVESYGAIYLMKAFSVIKFKIFKNIGFVVILFIIIYSFISFVITYYSNFKYQYSSYSQYVYKELSKNIELERKNKNIYLSTYRNDTPQYIYYLFYNKIDPQIIQNKKNISFTISNNGFIKIERIRNINFTDFNFTSGITSPFKNNAESIFFGSPEAFPKNVKTTRVFKDLSGAIIFEKVEYWELVN